MSKKKNEEAEKEPRRKTPTFLLELPLRVDACQAKRIRGHLEAGRAFYNAVLSEGQRRLRQMRADPAQAGRPAPSPGPTSRSGRPPFRPCGSVTAFPSTPFTTWRKCCASTGWPSTWTRCWLRRSPPAPTRPSIASVWERPVAYASRAAGGVFPASRTSATTRGCVSCCTSPKTAMAAM
jgi:hypothetical protein